MKRLFRFILLVIFMLAIPVSASQREQTPLLHIGPESFFALISSEGHLDIVDICEKNKDLFVDNCVIEFSPGLYRLRNSIRIVNFNIVKAASNIKSIELRAEAGARVVFDGSIPIESSKINYYGNDGTGINGDFEMPESLAAVYWGDPRGYFHKFKPGFPELVIDDGILNLRQWPNAKYLNLNKIGDYYFLKADDAKHLISFGFSNRSLIRGFWSGDWADELSGFDYWSDGRIKPLNERGAADSVLQNPRARFLNIPGKLDNLDEYYYDSTGVHFRVSVNKKKTVAITNLENAIEIVNSDDVSLSGLTVVNFRKLALSVSDSNRVGITKSAFKRIGGRAISVERSRSVLIRDNCFSDLAEGGVYVTSFGRSELIHSNILIARNEFDNFNRLAGSYRPAIRIDGVGVAAVGNSITSSHHASIIFSGNDNLILGNKIKNFSLNASDMGAIYTGRDWLSRGNAVVGNFISDGIKNEGRGYVMGIYLDDQASGVLVYNNIISNVQRSILVGGGVDNVIANNRISNSGPIYVDARGITWQKKQTNNKNFSLLKNYFSYREFAVFNAKYPEISDIETFGFGVPFGNLFLSNHFDKSPGIYVENEAKNWVLISENNSFDDAAWRFESLLDVDVGDLDECLNIQIQHYRDLYLLLKGKGRGDVAK